MPNLNPTLYGEGVLVACSRSENKLSHMLEFKGGLVIQPLKRVFSCYKAMKNTVLNNRHVPNFQFGHPLQYANNILTQGCGMYICRHDIGDRHLEKLLPVSVQTKYNVSERQNTDHAIIFINGNGKRVASAVIGFKKTGGGLGNGKRRGNLKSRVAIPVEKLLNAQRLSSCRAVIHSFPPAIRCHFPDRSLSSRVKLKTTATLRLALSGSSLSVGVMRWPNVFGTTGRPPGSEVSGSTHFPGEFIETIRMSTVFSGIAAIP